MGSLRVVLASLALACGAAAQSGLAPGDVAVVTDQGLWLVRASAPVTQLLPAAAFGGLVAPSVEWRPGTGELLVASDARLFRVTLTGPFVPSVSVEDITPIGLSGASLADLDVHPDSGELFLLDAAGRQVLRYAPPFAAGMAPDLVLALPATPRALAVESTEWPAAVTVGYGNSVRLHPLAGAFTTQASTGAHGLDVSHQVPNLALGCVAATDLVRVLVSASVVIEVNLTWNLCAPVADEPLDVEYMPDSDRVLVLAQSGVNDVCLPGYSGGNHVVTLPLGQSAGAPPTVLTGFASGITGMDGDLAWVRPDLAHVSPYGPLEPPTELVLAAKDNPSPGLSDFTLELTSGPAGAPAFLLAGLAPLGLTLPSGQPVLVQALAVLPIGTLGAGGKTSLGFELPVGLPLGLELFVQGAATSGGVLLSNGLRLHVAAP